MATREQVVAVRAEGQRPHGVRVPVDRAAGQVTHCLARRGSANALAKVLPDQDATRRVTRRQYLLRCIHGHTLQAMEGLG